MYRRQATSPNLNLKTPPVLRSRTASMGDVLAHGCTNKKTSGSPSHIPKRASSRSQSITTNSTQGLPNQSHKNSRKNSVASIGCHINSLISISSQVLKNVKKMCLMKISRLLSTLVRKLLPNVTLSHQMK